MSDVAVTMASAPAPAAAHGAAAPAPAPLPPAWTAELEKLAAHPQLGTIHGVNLASLPLLAQIASHLHTLAGSAAKPVDVSVTAESVTGLAEALSGAVEKGQSAQYDAVRSEIGQTNDKVDAVAIAQEETQAGIAHVRNAVSALGSEMEAKFVRLEEHIQWSREQFMQIDAVRLAFESQLHGRVVEIAAELARAFERLNRIEEETRQVRNPTFASESDNATTSQAPGAEKHARRSPPKAAHNK